MLSKASKRLLTCSETTLKKGLKAREFLDNNDSYSFFSIQGDLFKTGPTKTNVMDLRIMLVS